LLYREEKETDRRWFHDMPESGFNNEERREREISCDTTPGLDSGDGIDWDRQVRNRSVRSAGADAVSGTAGFQLALSETGSEIWGKGSIIKPGREKGLEVCYF
jgi:hypothetical protein